MIQKVLKKALTITLCGIAVCLTVAGCGKPNGTAVAEQPATTASANAAAAQPEVREITVIVYVDSSESITGYPGGLAQIQKDYGYIATSFLKPIFTQRDNIKLEGLSFVKTQATLFSGVYNKWERASGMLFDAIEKPPYKANEQSRTKFTELLDGLSKRLAAEQGRDVYVLVLSDGHPDEPFKDIVEAARAFNKNSHHNMVGMVIAPVESDLNNPWRDKLTDSLSVIDGVKVCNVQDYDGAVKEVLVKGGILQ